MDIRVSNCAKMVAWALGAIALLARGAHAAPPVTHAPFTYEIDYTVGQAVDPEFRGRFEAFAPDLYHGGSDLRYLGRYGFGSTMVEGRDEPYERFLENSRAYVGYLRARGVRWVIPYLCNQTLSGNPATGYGAWEVYDRWDTLAGSLGLGERPSDPLEWMQREPFGALHYNYKRMVFLERGMTAEDLRFAPCPNNPDWRRVCNAEARNAARAGYDGLFIDNCIIRCYCRHCEERFQAYLRDRYTPDTLGEAFGTRDYGQVVLHREGDAIQWALAQPEFIRWLEEKYPPEARRMPFDTTGALDLEHVAHAGSGMIIGEVSAFIAAQCLPPSVRPSFDAVRLANPALQTPAGRLRWAETCMFWAASIAEMLDEMGRAGREVSPDFFLVPNWGVMQRVNGAAGRAEEGKNTRLWKGGSTWHMFEEGYTTGRIAPGVVIEYDAELRFAFAHGVRAMLLPYTLAGQDVAEVGLAETAAAGGHVLVAIRQYPALYRTYREFFRDHASLYEGFRSAARVALAHCFDQTHYLNNEHLRCVAAINRYLADQQIPFDHVTEPDLRNPARLAAYRVVVLPALVFVDDAQRRAIRGYVESGGTVVLVGDFATHDERCRPTPGGIDVAADA
ncbi:MAG TPA: hypothetical protein PKL84_09750, partial [Candidatus Hydrogenedentes bacterium]|nr:hypothetical protein [Candidatus Hydrogenedentota bacterium]